MHQVSAKDLSIRSRGAFLVGDDSMNINGPGPIMDMSMNPNGYHQPYLPPSMMPPPPPHNVSGGPPQHHNEGQMNVGPPQQQAPSSHPSQQQQQQQQQQGVTNQNQGGNAPSSNNAGGSNSNPGSASGGENSGGMGGAGSGGESSSPNKKQHNNKSWPKKKVYKKPDPNAPKQRRFSGYYVYMRERRDQLRSMYPEMPFYEIIRQLAQEWNNMDREVKQKYLDSAEADKQNYEREMSAYKKTEQYKSMNKRKKKNPAAAQNSTLDMSMSGANAMSTANSSYNSPMMSSNLPGSSAMNMMSRPSHINHDTGMEIPIFTEEFLEHNKARELELRALRKTVTECEEQNATLQKHVEQMQQEIERMEHEMRQQKLQNEMLSQNLNRLRSVLASSFASLPLPGTHEPPNIHTIDKYMNEVKAMQEIIIMRWQGE
ncbi:high mobility group protein 20A isoform X2 [Folsomia candida]|uniref:high mobility group protein 20A isoform X2 n=1 Tax=Folsomia candida TaxID=158441 RepID=UPI001604BAC3|nr:high mobility group protein 20A isoform X2 [Folsomia candida]